MPHDVHDRDEISRMIEGGAQVVEVLGAEEFNEAHLPGAISIPLRKLDSEAPSRLDPTQAVIVYCWDSA